MSTGSAPLGDLERTSVNWLLPDGSITGWNVLFRKPYILVGITLFPLVISTLFLDWNLSRILRREQVFWEGQIRESQASQISDALKARVDAAWDIVNHYYSEGLGQEACKTALSKISPNGDGYIYVQKVDFVDRANEVVLVHPDKTFVGQPVRRVVDLERVNEVYFQGKVYPLGHPTVAGIQPTNVADQVNRICANEGSGVIHYYWARVVDGKASQVGYPKMTYIRYFPQWQWALGSGAYADHIDALIAGRLQVMNANTNRVRDLLVSSTLAMALVLCVISVAASRRVSRRMVQYEKFLTASQERLVEEAEKARQNERFFKTLITNLPQKVVLKDKNSKILYCNEKYAESLHRTVEEVIGRTECDFYPRIVANRHMASDRTVIDENKTLDGILRRHVHGHDTFTRVLKTPVHGEGGRVEGVLCVFEDFTERIRNEERLTAANAELEKTNRRVRETQAYLIQSEKMASIGQLAAGIAHEINNPMAYVVGNSHSLAEYVDSMTKMMGVYHEHVMHMASNGNPSCAEQAERILAMRNELDIDHICSDVHDLLADSQEGMGRVLRIVQNLRTFSRIDQADEVSPFDLNAGIKSTVAIANYELKDKAQVTTELGEIPEIYCHSGQINQVILNMLVNAAQAIASQGRGEMGTIVIRTRLEGDNVVCTIADDGPGIAPENLTRIFDPFFTTKPVGQGTGLGLHISYDIIVRRHRGQLRVESEPGKGATFTIKIPIDGTSNADSAKGHVHEPESSAVC